MAMLVNSNKENIEAMDVEAGPLKKESLKESTKPHDECQYLDLIKKILETGTVKGDRTGMSSMSVFFKIL